MSADIVEFSFFQKDDTNAKIKTVFLYNFTRYFEWPDKSGNFIITVYGENAGLISELTNMAKSKMVGSQKIEIKQADNLKEVEKTNILYILADKSKDLGEFVSKFKGKGTLIVTDKPGLAKVGATINFMVADNKQKFELNRASAKTAGLKVSNSLDPLAAAVYN